MGQGCWGEVELGGEVEEKRTSSTLPHHYLHLPPPPPFASPYTCSVFETGAVAGGAAGALLSVTANGGRGASWKYGSGGGTQTGRCVCGAVYPPGVSAHAVEDKDTWCTVETQQSGLFPVD